ncbi:MAG TPA: DISARM system phospholipase D-like protein DrmC [Propionibacteriaceae bacterium]|nr:DISARM system phospholipase D-like protein DrmC [Propionibacteriaceae bacterium]
MDSGSAAEALRQLGALLSATEAADIADALDAGESLGGALAVLAADRKEVVGSLLRKAGLGYDPALLTVILRAVEGALVASTTRLEPLWTMPGNLVQSSPLTSSVPSLVRAATTSVTCSTYNFQRTSGLWNALRDVVRRPQPVRVRVYVDTQAAEPEAQWKPPSPEEIAQWLRPAALFRTIEFDRQLVRNHAKFLVIDHRFLLVTSANFSRSAEFNNIEFGLKIDSPTLAESVEREIRGVEELLYARVQ